MVGTSNQSDPVAWPLILFSNIFHCKCSRAASHVEPHVLGIEPRIPLASPMFDVTLWLCHSIANWKMAIEIVSFPIENGDLP